MFNVCLMYERNKCILSNVCFLPGPDNQATHQFLYQLTIGKYNQYCYRLHFALIKLIPPRYSVSDSWLIFPVSGPALPPAPAPGALCSGLAATSRLRTARTAASSAPARRWGTLWDQPGTGSSSLLRVDIAFTLWWIICHHH